MGYFKIWATPLVYLLVYPFIVVFGQRKDIIQCITYLLFIVNSNMHWSKYIWFKSIIEQDLTLRTLFASLFSHSICYNDFFGILQTILYHCNLNRRLVYYLINSLFWLGRFPILLRNVFSYTETSPAREKQIGQQD